MPKTENKSITVWQQHMGGLSNINITQLPPRGDNATDYTHTQRSKGLSTLNHFISIGCTFIMRGSSI